MPVYSHSQLSVYEQRPLKYKLCYGDRMKRDEVEGMEGFLVNMVHETLKKCYDDSLLGCALIDLIGFLKYNSTIHEDAISISLRHWAWLLGNEGRNA